AATPARWCWRCRTAAPGSRPRSRRKAPARWRSPRAATWRRRSSAATAGRCRTGWCCSRRPRRASAGSATTGTAARRSPGPCGPAAPADAPLHPGSAEQAADVVGAAPPPLVVALAPLDVVEHVEMALRLAVLVQPDQRTGDVEGHPHRLRGLVRHERVRLAGRLIDPVPGGRHPVMLQVAPLAGDRVREDLLRV